MKEDRLVMAEVLGGHGVFNRENESEAERWVRVTKRLTDVVLCKNITPDGIRKHVEKLEKASIP
ncbi:PhosphoLipase [Phytophthora palmivora]|uniref:PhosphoLipase n=1 Tax=Phytophthora palmivora TaxID=4796 RepID=A0A2P4WXV0_9STRA|nr:PhosphoLipase [Phytophthora palmivora]